MPQWFLVMDSDWLALLFVLYFVGLCKTPNKKLQEASQNKVKMF